jgi:NCAIR mutase (PurE)-related protein
MRPETLRALLDQVARGERAVDEALRELEHLPFRDLGFARVDHHRHLRRGAPEVVLGLGKSAEQIAAILVELRQHGAPILATRVDAEKVAAVLAAVPGARFVDEARAVVVNWEGERSFVDRGRGVVAVVSAGTSDLPVAEEAALTAMMHGSRVERIHDVGVAGLHRLLAVRERLAAATVIIAVAGMEGALPSVVSGLVGRPVIAVPTSVGYGASFGGVAALLAMLNSCSSGITVVNIDNGFGAGYAAALINAKDEA